MEELKPVVSLEDVAKKPVSLKLKRALIAEVGRIAGILHQNGINHRDFYLCHFLLETKEQAKNPNSVKLSLIDLHRAQIRGLTPERWIIKDLAGLLFSCHEANLSQHDLYRFMRAYRKMTLREIFSTEKAFWQKVENRGYTYRDHTK